MAPYSEVIPTEKMKWLAEHVETIRIGKQEEACANCRNFMQHYIRVDGEYRKISRGHCMCGRLKDRGAGERCPRFDKEE